MLKMWGFHGKQGSSESAVWISLLRGYFNCSLLFTSGESQTWSGRRAADRTWAHHWVHFTHRIHPSLCLTLGLLNMPILPGLPLGWKSDCVKAKTAACGPHLFLQDVVRWTAELVEPEQDNLTEMLSCLQAKVSYFQQFWSLSEIEQLCQCFSCWTITTFGKRGCSCSVLL